ncbi:MAG: HAD-IIIA family hydrolase [Phycisphaeraceae bacterium]|nr:MAG: HAD-IIIA family hydrolase [Phycisphaeraceae bacterium]
MRPAVFLDRDDTLIACRGVAPGGDLGDPALVRLLPGVLEGCRRLVSEGGFALVVVSNQGGVARGRYDEEAVRTVNREVSRQLEDLIDGFYYCPYHPDGAIPEYAREHPWRKPAPGMLLAAAGELGLDLARSWMIGDQPRDAAAGKAAGCRTVLIDAGASKPAASPDAAEFVVPDFASAVEVILRNAGPGEAAPEREERGVS